MENKNIPIANYFFTFFFAILLRDFTEAYSQQSNHLNLPAALFGLELIHFMLFYAAIAMLLILVFHLATNTAIHKITRVVLPCFILLLFVPLFDLIITGGEGINLKYIQPGYDVDLLYSYLTYAGAFAGISLGIKLEVLILLIASYFYCRIKQVSMLRSALSVIFIYSLLFICSAMPIFIKWLCWLRGEKPESKALQSQHKKA